MKIYLVGGAVRDKLLGLAIKERDYVVVGATAAEMIQLGYRQVGKDFPVFLHPHTNEEHALARVERKISAGYTGFTVEANACVSLAEDLLRRDLTINAMAEDCVTGEIIDPYHGQQDIQNKILRHVSYAFIEDPVRILRLARFTARFAHLGFTIAPETIALMKAMVSNGEINALVPERVWKEWVRALSEKSPTVFFDTLEKCGAQEKLFPELNTDVRHKLWQCTALTTDPLLRFAVLVYPLNINLIRALCTRYHLPNAYRDLACTVNKFSHAAQAVQTPEQLLKLLLSVDALRKTERFNGFLIAQEIFAQIDNQNFNSDKFKIALATLKNLDLKPLLALKLKPVEFIKQLYELRLAAISN